MTNDALFILRIPCNEALAKHELIEVGQTANDLGCRVSVLGLINGIMRAMDLPSIAGIWDCDKVTWPELLGFAKYTLPHQRGDAP